MPNNTRFLIYSFLISVMWGILLYISVFISDENLQNFFILFVVSVFIAEVADKLIETKHEKKERDKYLNQRITLKIMAKISFKLVSMLFIAWVAFYYNDEIIKLLSIRVVMSLLHTGIGAFWMFQIQRAWNIRHLY